MRVPFRRIPENQRRLYLQRRVPEERKGGGGGGGRPLVVSTCADNSQKSRCLSARRRKSITRRRRSRKKIPRRRGASLSCCRRGDGRVFLRSKSRRVCRASSSRMSVGLSVEGGVDSSRARTNRIRRAPPSSFRLGSSFSRTAAQLPRAARVMVIRPVFG